MTAEQSKKVVVIAILLCVGIKAYVGFRATLHMPLPTDFLALAGAFVVLGVAAEFIPTLTAMMVMGVILAALVSPSKSQLGQAILGISNPGGK